MAAPLEGMISGSTPKRSSPNRKHFVDWSNSYDRGYSDDHRFLLHASGIGLLIQPGLADSGHRRQAGRRSG